jgi:hypothetical protein
VKFIRSESLGNFADDIHRVAGGVFGEISSFRRSYQDLGHLRLSLLVKTSLTE